MSQDPLSLLCIEPRFPGRLGAIADWLVRRRGYRCQFYCRSADPQEHWPQSVGKGLDLVQFDVGGVAKESSVPWTRFLERGLCYAYGCWEVLNARRPQPIDLVLGHSAGLGSSLFAGVYQPRLPTVNLFHYYYHARANDLAEEADQGAVEYRHWRRAANAMDLLDLENVAARWTCSRWQRDLYPAEYGPDFVVIPEGVDTRRHFYHPAREQRAARTIAGRTLPPEARIVSFVARSTDRLRGFDRFMDLVHRLQRARQDVLAIVVGSPNSSRALDIWHYGQNYRSTVLEQSPPHDAGRVWFLDNVRPQVVAELLAASDLHVYPSRAYPPSRSLIEAMASGCVVLAWDTQPVQEMIRLEQTGLIAGDIEQAEAAALAVLQNPQDYRSLGQAAAAWVRETCSLDVTVPQLAELFDRLVAS